MTYNIAYIVTDLDVRPSWPGYAEDIHTHKTIPLHNMDNTLSPRHLYQLALDACESDVLIYMHSDVVVHEEFWRSRVLSRFSDPEVVAVGLGGATSLGNKDLYRKRYDISNMARSGYVSNSDDAEVHGYRFDGHKRVAVLDAYFMAIRTSWMKPKGWPKELTHHCLDTWIACESARDKKKTYVEGCSCVHHGGLMSIGEKYSKAKWLLGGSTESDHKIPHHWLWDKYRDVLPIRL